MMRTETNTMEPRLSKGFGAGVGGALVMIAVMALLRFGFGILSLPELLQGTFLYLVPGDVFEFMIHLLGPGAKVLLLVQVLEGMLLVGGILGWLFARRWRPAEGASTGLRGFFSRRWGAGLLYGVYIAIGLNLVYLLLYSLDVLNPRPANLAPIMFALVLYGLAFGLSLVALLRWPSAARVEGVAPQAAVMVTADDSRRGFLRMAGGTVVALAAGGGLWAVLTNALKEPAPAVAVAQGGTQLESGGANGAVPETSIPTPLPTNTPVKAAAQPTKPATNSNTATVAPADTATAQPTKPAETVADTPAPTSAAAEATATAEQPVAATAEATATAEQPVAAAPTDTAVAVAQGVEPTPTAFPAVPVLVPEITPVESYYITTKNYIDPSVDAATWNLRITGLVDKAYTLTLDDIKKLPSVKVVHTLECISNNVGGDLIGNARWTGVKLADIIKKAQPQQGASEVIFHAADDYTDSIVLADAVQDSAMLVYEMNGAPLTQKHGFPARLLIPGIYGMKNLKWINQIELANYDYKGYWQKQGWSDPAPYQTMSRIDYPVAGTINTKPLYVGGVAFAGKRGINRVELSLDGGQTWADAQLRRPLSQNSWVLWTAPWVPSKEGDYTLAVRATDGAGEVQTSDQVGNYPNGATGYHTIRVRVIA